MKKSRQLRLGKLIEEIDTEESFDKLFFHFLTCNTQYPIDCNTATEIIKLTKRGQLGDIRESIRELLHEIGENVDNRYSDESLKKLKN